MTEDIMIEEKIMDAKDKLRTKKTWYKILKLIILCLLIPFIVFTIKFINLDEKFDNGSVTYMGNYKEEEYIIYKEKPYPIEEYENACNIKNNFYSLLVANILINIPLIIISMFVKNKIKRQKEIIENLENQQNLKTEENPSLNESIPTTSKLFCEYCGSIIEGDICNSCGAKIHKDSQNPNIQ